VCRYREIDESHHLIQWFWEILESFSNDERILFMRFVSGRSRLPMNPSDITQRFQILKIDRVNTMSLMSFLFTQISLVQKLLTLYSETTLSHTTCMLALMTSSHSNNSNVSTDLTASPVSFILCRAYISLF